MSLLRRLFSSPIFLSSPSHDRTLISILTRIFLFLKNIVQILLRLEKYPQRMNFTKGILETTVQTYTHLKKLLKTIPLETPTEIELSPGNVIRVTLFDANHCTGAVMFLFQGSDGKAILYTGDIRSEAWWVNSLVQNPVLLPYSLGSKRLDKMYLDTTFASKSDPYRDFPSKAAGLCELVEKVQRYPKHTVFYVEAWTFGYENVWIALSALLQSPVHLDRYRWGIYKSLSGTKGMLECVEAPPLLGFQFGNHRKDGCLTPDPNVRIHSCERGTECSVIDGNANVVRLVPIVTRLSNGAEMQEMGIGGGQGDLDQTHELEVADAGAVVALMQLCALRISNQEDLLKVYALLQSQAPLDLEADLDGNKLDDLVDILIRMATERKSGLESRKYTSAMESRDNTALPKEVTFPYSRHSSYSELCALVAAFKPQDVHPCTVDEATWTPAISMRALFGHLCSGDEFSHDVEMYEARERRREETSKVVRSHTETQSLSPLLDQRFAQDTASSLEGDGSTQSQCTTKPQEEEDAREEFFPPGEALTNSQSLPTPGLPTSVHPISQTNQHVARSSVSTVSPPQHQGSGGSELRIREWAYRAAVGLDERCDSWDTFGGLSCVRQMGVEEIELGEDVV